MRRTPANATLAILAALVAAAALRLWGIGFSATIPWGRPDEELFIIGGLRYFGGRPPLDQIPRGWPEGFFRIVYGVEWVEAHTLDAVFGRPVNLGCLYALNPIAVGFGGRLVSVVSGTLACLIVGLTAGRLARPGTERPAIVFGVLALGCNYLAGRDAHFGVSDATLSVLLAAAAYCFVRAVQSGSRWLVGAAAFAGAACSVKYAAVPIVIPAAVAGVAALRLHGNRRPSAAWILAAAVVAAVSAFAVLSPSVALAPSTILDGLWSHWFRYGERARAFLLDPAADVAPGWRFYLTTVLPAAFGWFGLATALCGVMIAARRDKLAGAVVAIGAAAFFLPLVTLRAMFARYGSPVALFLSIGLGVFLAAANDAVRARARGWIGLAASAAIALAALGPPAWRLVRLDRILARADTRDLASAWLVGRGPEATHVSQGAYARIHGLEHSAVAACAPVVPARLARAVPMLPDRGRNWSLDVASGSRRWAAIAESAVYDSDIPVDPLRARYVSQSRAALPCGRLGKQENWSRLNPSCFALEVAIFPGTPDCSSDLDLFDSLFVPFARLGGQRRPGPEINVYRNTCAGSRP